MDKEGIGRRIKEFVNEDHYIIDRESLKSGMDLLIPHMFGGIVCATVCQNCGFADDGGTIWVLEYDDDRGRWVTTGGVNKLAIKKL
jgi:hypothetical protein